MKREGEERERSILEETSSIKALRSGREREREDSDTREGW